MLLRATVPLAACLACLPGCDDELIGEITAGEECEVCSVDADCNQTIGLTCIEFPDQVRRCAFPGSECGVGLRIEPGMPGIASGELPWVTAADFDGDGRADLALVPEGDGARGGVEVRLAAQPEAPRFVATDGPATALAAADVDGDGACDLVVTSEESARVSWLRGHGDGSFDTAGHAVLASAGSVVVAADLDAAGGADLAVGSAAGDAIAIVLAGSDGLRVAATLATDAPFDRLLVRDVDGDRTPDLIAYDAATGASSAFRGLGDGRFGDRWPPRRAR